MMNHEYVAVCVGLMDHRQYFYGSNVGGIVESAREFEKKIKNHRIEGVYVHYFQTEDRMMDYINDKKAFYQYVGKNIEFKRMDK